tara:strand:- start:13 stop:699 length:687 start_codon:yes stop_codon:yes gene_type:complete
VLDRKEIFSSKPNQIAIAAIEISKIIFGDLNLVKIIIIGDSKLPFSIGANLDEKSKLKCEKNNKSIFEYLDFKSKKPKNLDSLANFLSNYEVILIGFESDLKLISYDVVSKILEKRKQKPIFFVDCGIPGNVEQDITKINNCFLFDLNDLEQYFSREKNNLEITGKESFDEDSFDEEINNYLSSFTKKMNLNSSQVSMFEKYLRLYFNENLTNEEKKVILKFLDFFKK